MPRGYDVDEPDLYPPDIEIVTPELRQQRNRAIIGVALVTFGLGVMLERVLDNDLEVFWLALGAGLLAGWARAPRFPLFAAGAIITGFGLEDFVESLLTLRFESALGAVLVAAGFLAVYVRYPQRAKWALIPAGIMGLLAVADFGIGLLGLIPGAVTGLLLPLALIGGGLLLVFRNRLPSPLVKCGVVVALAVFVSAGMSGMDDFEGFGSLSTRRDITTTLDPLEGRQLVLDVEEGDIDITPAPAGASPVVTASVHGSSRGRLAVVYGEETVVVRLANGRRHIHWHDAAYIAVVPPGTDLAARTEEGDIEALLSGGAVELATEDGDVRVELTADDGSVDIRADDGNVELDGGRRDPAVEATTGDGEVDADLVGPGDRRDGDRRFTREGTGADVVINVDEGDIELRNLA